MRSINTVLLCITTVLEYSTILQNGSFVMSHSLSLSEFVIENLKSPQHIAHGHLVTKRLIGFETPTVRAGSYTTPCTTISLLFALQQPKQLKPHYNSIIVHHYRLLQVYLSDDDFKAYKQDRFIARLV